MKSLIVLVVGLLAVGCGQSDVARLEEEKWTQEYETEFQMSEDENKRLKAEIESNKLKAELEVENKKKKDDLLEIDVLGEYEYKKEGYTVKFVFLDNGVYEYYINGKKTAMDSKWSIVKEEIHIKYDSGLIWVYRFNKDKSITRIAGIDDGKRIDLSNQLTYKKIK